MPDAPYVTSRIGLAAIAVVAATLLSTALVVGFIVRIPPGYFLGAGDGVAGRIGSPVGRALYRIGRNLLGLALVGLGVILALPGVPGQGLLTILVGVLLLEIPGKRRIELAIVRRPAVLRGINAIRARFDQPPLVIDTRPPGRDQR